MTLKRQLVEQKAKEVKEKYDYLDTLPEDGWFWEFVRRSEEYILKFQAVERYDCSNCEKNTDWHGKPTESLFAVWSDILMTGVQPDAIEDEDTPDLVFPNHLLRYVDFPADKRPRMRSDNAPVRVHAPSEDKNTTLPISPDAASRIVGLLTPTTIADTIFVGISRKASYEEIVRALRPAIEKYLQPSPAVRMRTEQWKYYLITYDLKGKGQGRGHSYGMIAKILVEAYPEVFDENFTEKNVQNFYRRGLVLINGGYKKYLFIKEPEPVKITLFNNPAPY